LILKKKQKKNKLYLILVLEASFQKLITLADARGDKNGRGIKNPDITVI
jgi:hypothetical protein